MASFSFIFGHFIRILQYLQQINLKMFIQYAVLGFKLITFGT